MALYYILKKCAKRKISCCHYKAFTSTQMNGLTSLTIILNFSATWIINIILKRYNTWIFQGFQVKEELIVTQTPLPDTIVDFWRLVHDYKCNLVVSLNTLGSQVSLGFIFSIFAKYNNIKYNTVAGRFAGSNELHCLGNRCRPYNL